MHSLHAAEVENNLWVDRSSNTDFNTANSLLQLIIALYMYLICQPK